MLCHTGSLLSSDNSDFVLHAECVDSLLEVFLGFGRHGLQLAWLWEDLLRMLPHRGDTCLVLPLGCSLACRLLKDVAHGFAFPLSCLMIPRVGCPFYFAHPLEDDVPVPWRSIYIKLFLKNDYVSMHCRSTKVVNRIIAILGP